MPSVSRVFSRNQYAPFLRRPHATRSGADCNGCYAGARGPLDSPLQRAVERALLPGVQPPNPPTRMIPTRILPFLFTTVFALMLGAPASQAGLGGIHDGGEFFSDQAKAEASRTIGDVERSMKKDIIVE